MHKGFFYVQARSGTVRHEPVTTDTIIKHTNYCADEDGALRLAIYQPRGGGRRVAGKFVDLHIFYRVDRVLLGAGNMGLLPIRRTKYLSLSVSFTIRNQRPLSEANL